MRVLVTQFLEHRKSDEKLQRVKINGYTIDKIELQENHIDPFYEAVAIVNFSIVVHQLPSSWSTFPGAEVDNKQPWYLNAFFGIFLVKEFF